MMEVCMNNNAAKFEWAACQPTAGSSARPKRDFRFQVIEVCQGPKWFIWPSRNRGSNENVDENHNKEAKSVGVENAVPGPCNPINQFATLGATQNGYGAMRRSVIRSSKRKQLEGVEAPARTASEPAPRRLSLKKEKAATEPINGPSNTFKILSIAKKWESFDATDDETDTEISCSCKTLCLDDADRRRTAPH